MIEFACSEHTIVQLASLQALTNLSVIDQNHAPYTKLIHQLYELLDRGPVNVGLQALKILVNLSSNEEMVPHLLAAKVGTVADFNASAAKLPCFVLISFITRKRYSIGEVLKHIFLSNPRIAKVLADERDVKPRNMNLRGGED